MMKSRGDATKTPKDQSIILKSVARETRHAKKRMREKEIKITEQLAHRINFLENLLKRADTNKFFTTRLL